MGTVGKIVKPIIDNNRGYEIFVLYIFINYKVLFIFITSVVYALLCFVVAFIVSVHGLVPDFRRGDKGNIRHRLSDIIILMILGRACGHVGRADIIEFGKHNL